MRVGDKVRVISPTSSYCGAKGVIEEVDTRTRGYFVKLNHSEAYAHLGLMWFGQWELEVIEEGKA